MTRNLSRTGYLVVGASFGLAIALSCSDDSPSDADAAACDCPAAEPPLAGRFMVVRSTSMLPPMALGGADASCPVGATLVTGSCFGSDGGVQVPLLSAGTVVGDTDFSSWSCQWNNTTASEIEAVATVKCLMPAQ